MSDWLDELLAMLPAEPYPEDLADHIQARLAKVRRRSRRIRQVVQFSLVVVSISGLWIILPWVETLLVAIPDLSLDPADEWLSALASSPGESLLNLSGTILSWISELASTMDIEIVLVLGILTASALYGIITLLSNGASQEEVMV